MDMDMRDFMASGRFQPQVVANSAAQDKPKADWSNDDKKKVQYDLKARNILISFLGVNEYHSVCHCRTAKHMWDSLETFHEGTNDVKQSKINTIVQQYDHFYMEDGETVSSMQMRFTHIVNKLQNLGNKILRCMTKEWQPKVTAIKESQNLNVLSMITLFRKLKEHEHEITRFKSSEEGSKLKDKKPVVFKASSSKASSSNTSEGDSKGESTNEEDMVLFVKRFNRYIKKHGLRCRDKSSRISQTKGENSIEENVTSDKSKGRRDYIAW